MVTLDSTVCWGRGGGILMVTLDSTVCWGRGGGDSHGYFRQHCLLGGNSHSYFRQHCLLGGEFSWLL